MKKVILTTLLIILFAVTNGYAQIEKFQGGFHKPAITEGGKPLHALVVFALFENDTKPDNSGIWPAGKFPTYSNELFDIDTSNGITPYTLTDYWYNMSGGKFVFTGEVYPELVTLRPESYYRETRRNFGSTNQEVLEQIKDKTDFARFDNWSYDYKNKKFLPEADGIADMVIIIYRTPDAYWFTKGVGEEFSAIALLGNKEYEVVSHDKVSIISKPVLSRDISGLTVRTGIKSKMDLLEIISHEFGHFLFGSGHTKIGGIMGGGTFALNAWEKMALGYVTPVNVKSDTTGYILKDFLNDGEVLKINYPADQENTNRYFLIENHKRANRYDFICRGGKSEGKYTLDGDYGKGLYVYSVSAGNVFPPRIEMLTADGLWKWNIADTIKNSELCGCDVPVFQRLGPDNINGKSDRDIQIYFNKSLWPMWYDINPYTGAVELVRNNMGDEYDAFTKGMVFTGWSNPSSKVAKSRISVFSFYVEDINENNDVVLTMKFGENSKDVPPSPPQYVEGSLSEKTVKLMWWTNHEPNMQNDSYYLLFRKTGVDGEFEQIAEIPVIKSANTYYEDNIEDIESDVLYYMVKSKDSKKFVSTDSRVIKVKISE